MNMDLNIPKEDFESLIELLNLSDNEFNSIVEDIKKISIDLDFKSIESRLKDITSNYKVILGLYFTFCKFDIPEEKFSQQLLDYYNSKIGVESSNEEIKDRLLKIFKKDNPIRVAVKSRILISEVSSLYHESRILTDIRPVFSSNEENDVIGKVILSNLKISYRKADVFKEFFVTLEEEDLKELKNTVDRAIEKTKQLKLDTL
jgi:hypothetical protein